MACVPPPSRHGYKRSLDQGDIRSVSMPPEGVRSAIQESQKAAHPFGHGCQGCDVSPEILFRR